jgi:hypothetical protein
MNSTQCILDQQGPSCLSCVQQNGCFDPAFQGATCEGLTGTEPHFTGTLPDGQSCTNIIPSGTTETAVCLETMSKIFASGCFDTLNGTSCICGNTDATQCLAGTTTPTGPLYDLYACDGNTVSVHNLFLIPDGFDTGEGIVQCAAAFNCGCFTAGCVPATSCAPTQTCGFASNGCGGTINCGSCPAGQVCTGTSCCQPATACPSGQTCGIAPDGCGGTINCGSCPAGQVCSGTSCCQPATACPSGQTCGTASDGCGGTLSCGTCGAGLTCSATGQCGTCVPKTCAAGQCGTIDDGCGGTLACGGCASGQICGVDNSCHVISTGCSATGGSTTACLSAQGPTAGACFACAQTNGCLDPTEQGGSCEDTAGTQPHFGGTLPDGKTCASVFSQGASESEAQVCLETLGTIFASRCSASLQETPCLCGTTDAASCLAGTAPPNGPDYDEYVCDFNTTSVQNIQVDFTNQLLGAGQANGIVQCVAAFGCPCF